MKLKLKNPPPALAGATAESPAPVVAPVAPAPAPTAAPKLNLKIKKVNGPTAETADGQPADAPKQKRKYTKKPKVDDHGQPLAGAKPGPKPKKRPLEDGEEGTPAKRKPKPTAKSLAMVQESDDDDDDMLAEPALKARPSRPQPVRTQSVKLSFKPKGAPAPPQRSGTAIIKVKGQGKPPARPYGVGYDSEADEAEIDPAIESQFILRMLPGPDCDLLRKSIEEKTIGKPQSQGGPGVYFRFFDREGRKAMVIIQGRYYAASMVELPCVIESLKSWNKKDWVKTADVCQMLLVLGRVNNEEEAKKFPRPREVEPDSHRYPHGLTPPMHWVRKRRFRPRKSYLDVERIETHTESLMQADEDAEETRYELVDSDAEMSPDQGSEDEDAEGSDDDMMGAAEYVVETPVAEGVDESELAQMFHDELAKDDFLFEADGDAGGLFGGEGATIEIEAPATTAHDVAMHALSQHANVVAEPESAASTPAGATSGDDDDDDDGDDDDEADPEAKAKQALIEQTRAEIRELEQAIDSQKQQLASSNNILWKKRLQSRIDKMIQDKKVKLSKIGEAED